MNPDEKPCPFCGETIKAVARKCKHCGEWLPDGETPPAPASISSSAPPTSPPAALETGRVFDLLTHLVDKNLVAYEEDERGQGRYRLLETVRQYARDRLREGGDSGAPRMRHRDYFLALAQEASAKLRGAEQKAWLDRLETEHDNLRAVLEWCQEMPGGSGHANQAPDHAADHQSAAGIRLSAALWQFWYTRGYLSEGRRQFAAVLSPPSGVPGLAPELSQDRANALLGAGNLAFKQGDYVVARTAFEESLAAQRALGNLQGAANVLGNLGCVLKEQGDLAAARAAFEESLAAQREAGNRQGIASALGNLAGMAEEQGQLSAARTLLEESLAIDRELGNRQTMATNLGVLANVTRGQGDSAMARSLHEQSLAILRDLGDKSGMTIALYNLSRLDLDENELAGASRFLAECLRLCREIGGKYVGAFGLKGSAQLAQARAEPQSRAVQLLGSANALLESMGAPPTTGDREEAEREMNDLRAVLGEESFAHAWALGRAMTWEQAIEYALEENAP